MLRVGNGGFRPSKCPMCPERWSNAPDATLPADVLIDALRRLTEDTDSPIMVHLEIDADAAAD